MRSLDRKLLRDLWRIRGQALAIALVVGSGVAMYVLMLATFESLELTRQTYYERFRFADVFASLRRAPLRVEPKIGEIPGVARAETRVVVDVTLDVPGMNEPATGRLISIPDDRRPLLCDVYLRQGRWIERGRADEVLISEPFAEAHGLSPGDTVAAIINGRRRDLRVVGVALSPEYVYNIRPGELIPDDTRFGIFWMERRALAAAFDMEGGFNDVVLTLMHSGSEREVIARLDALLEPYGGLGAIPRRLQTSHWYLQNELNQLSGIGAVVPIIFLAVAAFLVNIVLSRIVNVEREQIAVIKALGYSNRDVGLHYVKWALVVAAVGCVIGLAAGAWLGRGMTVMYTSFFDFPILEFTLPPTIVLSAIGMCLAAAILGALNAVRRAATLPPAEAMRPEPPADFGVSWIERAGLRRFLTQPTRMILRNLQRHPGRSAVSLFGIASGAALLILGSFSLDAIHSMMDLQFNVAQRYDVMVSFVEPTSARAWYEVTRLPGVLAAEPFRSVPVRLRHGPRSRQTSITGIPAEPRLNRLIDASYVAIHPPPEGLAMSKVLAEILGVTEGDSITVEVLEGQRPVRPLRVVRLVDDFMGTGAWMHLDALHALMREGETLSGAYLAVDERQVDRLYTQLKNTPRIAGVMLKDAAIEAFDETLNEMIGTIRLVNTVFAVVIAFGVVYNSARISLAERGRELATLRVIGFTRAEIGYILLGELVVLTLLAIPLGMLMGYGLAGLMVKSMNSEVWRMPLTVSPRTQAFAALTVVAATALSSLIVRRRLNNLDLVEVLKTRE